MGAKITTYLKKRDFEIIKELSLIGAHMIMEVNKVLTDEQYQGLFNLISRCSDEEIDIDDMDDYNFKVDLKLIEEYNEVTFWRELAKKLAARDTIQDLGEDINTGNFADFEKIKAMYERTYMEKFAVSKDVFNNSKDESSESFDTKFLPY